MKKHLLLAFSLIVYLNQGTFAQTKIWGTSSPGYFNQDGGSVYYTDNSISSVNIAHTFNFSMLGNYNYRCKLTESSVTGKFYGTTYSAGANGEGVLFAYDPVSLLYTALYDIVPIGGIYSNGPLLEASNGKLYGSMSQKGLYDKGTLFEFDPVLNVYTKLVDFDSVNGSGPTGKLLQASNGKLYGITSRGGASNEGTIFEYDLTTGSFSKKADVSGIPIGNVIQAVSGKIYAITYNGGLYNRGMLLEYDITTNIASVKFNFSSALTDGMIEDFYQASNGKLYGATYAGGSSGSGSFFEFNLATNTYLTKYSFSSGMLGKNPFMLSLSPSGTFYGSCDAGGPVNRGVFFEYDPIGNIYTMRVNYFSSGNSTKLRAIATKSDGNVLGLTCANMVASSEKGTIVAEINTTTNTYSKKIGVNAVSEHEPLSIVRAANGKIYGTLFRGGDSDHGALFGLDPATSAYTKEHAFESTGGHDPLGNLIAHSNGKIYGLTSGAAAYNRGAFFEFDPATNVYTAIHHFGAVVDESPYTNIMQASNGKIYGMIKRNSVPSAYCASIYEYDPLTLSFSIALDSIQLAGYGSETRMVQASNGILYGITESLGSFSGGYLFAFDPATFSFSVKHNFSCATGCAPNGSLVEWSPGKLYGLTNDGGINSTGVVYEFDVNTDTFIKKYDLPTSGVLGGTWSRGFVKAANNKLYADFSSENRLFEYDPSGSTGTVFNPFVGSIVSYQSSRLMTMSCEFDCDVWPGDADNSNLVDNADLLPIGLHYGQSGFVRSTLGNVWQADSSADWGASQLNGSDLKHVDCNGDGTIDNNDTLAINLNYSSAHFIGAPLNNLDRSSYPELYFQIAATSYAPGSWVDVDVMVGNATLPVSDLYGIAFNISYDASLVQPGTESLSFPSSWFSSPGINGIKLSKVIPLANTIAGSESRIDHLNADGFGKIATFRFQTKSSISSVSQIDFSFSGYVANDSIGNAILLSPQSDSILVDPMLTSIDVLTDPNRIVVYPNPFAGSTTINYFLLHNANVVIEVYNTVGQKIETITDGNQVGGTHQYSFSAKEKDYDAGIYFMKFTIDGKVTMKKIVEVK